MTYDPRTTKPNRRHLRCGNRGVRLLNPDACDMKAYIIKEHRTDLKKTFWVCAKPGYMRCSDGKQRRDGLLTGGPEWTTNRDHAFQFESHRAAARVASKCPSATIEELKPWI